MKALENTLRWIAIIGIFALPFVPFVVSNDLFFPFITGKNFAFRIIVEILACAWLALALVSSKYRPKRGWILGTLAAFVLVIAVADAQGAYPFKSFWSNYERMDGWITIAHLLAYTVVASIVINTEKLWRTLFKLSVGLSVLMSLWGFAQVLGWASTGFGGAAGLEARIDARFGNPIYMAAYMLFHVFIAAMLWAQSWRVRGPGKRLAPSLLYGGAIVLDTIALLLTGTRGTTVGLAAGVVVTAFIVLLLARRSTVAWRGALAALAVTFVLGAGFYMIRDAAWVKQVGFLNRLSTISLQDATTKARFLNWGIAWEGVKERPVFGWGQENYAIVFDKYYDPRMYAQEQWFDRVHNIVFDWLVAGGFLGLLAYLGIFAAALWTLWRRALLVLLEYILFVASLGLDGARPTAHREPHTSAFTISERALLTGLLVAYFIHNFFVFDNVTSYILFGTVLAYLAWRSAEARRAEPVLTGTLLPHEALPVVAVVMTVVAGILVFTINVPAYAANRALIQGIQISSAQGIMDNLAAIKRSIGYGSYGMQEAREQLSQIAAQVAGSELPTDVKEVFYAEALAQMTAQEKMSPLDARFPLFTGITHEAFGNLVDAAASLDRAHTLSPRKQTILFEVGQNALLRNDTRAALDAFKEAYELEPLNTAARVRYVAILIRTGNDREADTILAPIIPTGEAAVSDITGAYAERKQYGKLIPIWEARVKVAPDDIQAYFTLAASLYGAGNRARAITTLQSAKEHATDDDSRAQIDEFIRQIQAGTVQI